MHKFLATPLFPPFPEPFEIAVFGMGCFWGAEKSFWKHPGVISTQVGYSGGDVENPNYKQVCRGGTNHTEVVRVVFDPRRVRYQDLLKVFWENHHFLGKSHQKAQYASVIFVCNQNQCELAERSKRIVEERLQSDGNKKVATAVRNIQEFYYAEDYHQQYLIDKPHAECGTKGNGFDFDVALLG